MPAWENEWNEMQYFSPGKKKAFSYRSESVKDMYVAQLCRTTLYWNAGVNTRGRDMHRQDMPIHLCSYRVPLLYLDVWETSLLLSFLFIFLAMTVWAQLNPVGIVIFNFEFTVPRGFWDWILLFLLCLSLLKPQKQKSLHVNILSDTCSTQTKPLKKSLSFI